MQVLAFGPLEIETREDRDARGCANLLLLSEIQSMFSDYSQRSAVEFLKAYFDSLNGKKCLFYLSYFFTDCFSFTVIDTEVDIILYFFIGLWSILLHAISFLCVFYCIIYSVLFWSLCC